MRPWKLFLTGPLLVMQMACASTASWWQQPPIDTAQAIYGLGEGQTLALAQQQALADISGKLSTQVSASLDRVTQDTGIAYNDTIRRQIRSKTQQTELSQFQLIKSTEKNKRFFVLIELDRPRLADVWRVQLEEKRSKLIPLIQRNSVDNFAQWVEIHQALNAAADARNLSLQLFALDGTAPQTDLHHRLTQLLLSKPLGVSIKGNNNKLSRTLQEQLNLAGLRPCQMNCNLRLSYTIDTEHDTMFGEFVSDTSVQFTLHENNLVLTSAELNAQVTSVSGYKSADEGSLISIAQQLKQIGLWQLLGVQL